MKMANGRWLMANGKRWVAGFCSFVLAMAVMGLVTGCASMAELGTSIGVATGSLTQEQADSINRSAVAIEKTFKDITPEQEYYIGRSVAATVLDTYKVYDVSAANEYLNLLGQTLAQASDKPETFGGYHFVLMDTDEINAFSAPGGLVMISRGMIRCCKNEDELAAVLAHEIGHVSKQHGLKAIKKGRLTSALTILALEAGKNLAGDDLAEVTKTFEGSISDITGTMMNSGYARTTEFEADQAAIKVMQRVGYNPRALVSMLKRMRLNLKPGGHDFAQTHPPPEVRIAEIEKTLGAQTAYSEPPVRTRRFSGTMGNI